MNMMTQRQMNRNNMFKLVSLCLALGIFLWFLYAQFEKKFYRDVGTSFMKTWMDGLPDSLKTHDDKIAK